MSPIVRPARWSDVPAMVALVERQRVELERLAPLFWRRARHASAWTRRYFRFLLLTGPASCLVAEAEGTVSGFLIARRRRAPPVYDPGGASLMIDDFCVAGAELWPSVGTALLDAAVRRAGTATAQLIVVAPVADAAKSQWLASQNLQPVTQWWTKPC